MSKNEIETMNAALQTATWHRSTAEQARQADRQRQIAAAWDAMSDAERLLVVAAEFEGV